MFNYSLESIRGIIIRVLDSTFHDEYLLVFLAKEKVSKNLSVNIAIHRLLPIDNLVIEKIKNRIKEKLDCGSEVSIINMTDRTWDKDYLEVVLKNGLLWRKPVNYGEFLEDLKDRAINISVEKLLKELNNK